MHIPGALPDPRDKLYGQSNIAADVVADRISFATNYGLRVPAIVYHKPGATIVQHPALVVVNPPDGDKSAKYAWWTGILYARAGAIVVTYDSIGEFERNNNLRSGFDLPDQGSLPLTAIQVTDVLQAVHYLANRKDVDAKRMAVLGFDRGGSRVSELACALDASLSACVLPAPGATPSPLGDSVAVLSALIGKRGLTGTAEKNQLAFALTRPVAVWLEEKLKFP